MAINTLLKTVLKKINKKAEDQQRKEGVPAENVKPVIFLAEDSDTFRRQTGFRSIDPFFGSTIKDEGQIESGYADGKVYIIYGPHGSGKTTFTLQMAGELQKNDPDAYTLYIDVENRFEKNYAKALGVDTARTLVVQRNSFMERNFDTITEIIATGQVKLIVLDSLQAGIHKDELHETGNNHVIKGIKGTEDNYAVGIAAKKNNQFFRTVLPMLNQYDTTMLVIGQVRSDIDPHGGFQLTGGHVAKHNADAIIRLQRTGKSTWPQVGTGKDKKYIGFRSRFVAEKVAGLNPQTTVELPFYQGSGFDEKENTIQDAILSGIIIQGGAWYTVNGLESDLLNKDNKVQGRDALMEIFSIDDNYNWLLENLGRNLEVLEDDSEDGAVEPE